MKKFFVLKHRDEDGNWYLMHGRGRESFVSSMQVREAAKFATVASAAAYMQKWNLPPWWKITKIERKPS